MQAIYFLVDSVASFFAALFVLRFLMQACRVSFGGPFGHFVVTLTNWAVKPLRRAIPGVAGFDWASVVAAYVLLLVPALLVFVLFGAPGAVDAPVFWLSVLMRGLISLLRLVVYVYIGALILQAVLSWINPYSPLAGPADQLTRPLLAPIRSVLPPLSGIDLSPLVAILLLQVVLMFL
jgi:YggT family protein